MIKTWKETYPDYIAKQGDEAISQEIACLFSVETISSYFKNANHRIWIIVDSQDDMVGYLHVILPCENKKPAFLQQIYIIQKEQGKKLGSLLLEQCDSYLKENKLSDIKLEVDTDNKNAINFYKKKGFKIKEKVPYDEVNAPGYYNYVMEKTLKSPGKFAIWTTPEEKNMSANREQGPHLLSSLSL